MKQLKFLTASLAVAGLLAACGDSVDQSRGTLLSLTSTGTLTTSDINAQVLAVSGATPPCTTVNLHHFEYYTVGGVGEATTASGGIMTPQGNDPACQGERPVLLYAHGTTLEKNKNMASRTDSESNLIAATFAMHGYIVVAPNYAGYDTSSLGYHPYLVADQQSKDMIDGLSAARTALSRLGATANSKLFVSGYSQGGHVALATVRAMQSANMTVSAAAPMSGPYNLGVFGDAVFGSQVNAGATAFTPLLITAYQKTYRDIYQVPSDMFTPAFANTIENILPSATSRADLITAGKLPTNDCMFEAAIPPLLGGGGYGTCASGFLVKTDYRLAALANASTTPGNPATGQLTGTSNHPLRRASYANQLLNFSLRTPSLFCGGRNDPTVFYNINTASAHAHFASQNLIPAAALFQLDIDAATSTPPFATLQAGFTAAKTAAGGAALAQYHGALVPPFCNRAAREFFAALP